MTDYAALKAEDAKPIYNGQTDVQRSAAINALTVTGLQAVKPIDARLALIFQSTRDWGWLVGVAAGQDTNANASGSGAVAVTAATRQIAASIRDLFNTTEPVPLQNSSNVTLLQTALNALVTANVITAAGRTAVLNLPNTSVSWPIYYGFPQGVNPGELQAARLFNG